MDIRGKVALVTGAGAGIGRASALALAAEGASVMVADADDIGGTETVRRIQEDLGGAAAFVKVDLAFPHDVRTMYEATEGTFGGVDIVHNHAGLIGGAPLWPDVELEKIDSRRASGHVSGHASSVRVLSDGLPEAVRNSSTAATAPRRAR